MQTIESEPTVLAPQSKPSRVSPIRHPLAGLAVAASVTAVVILGARGYLTASDVSAPVAQVQTAPIVAASPASAAVTTVAEQQAVPDEVQSKLNRYLLNHNQNAIGVHGMLPYARIVGYNSGESAE